MTETDEDWVQLAMGDACVVADLLLRILRQPRPSSRSWLHWTVRARRSRPQPRNSDGVTKEEATDTKPKVEQARASPSTPLSWSGTATTSGGASEESPPSIVDRSNTTRSKAPLASVAPTKTPALIITAGKRPRQKKRSLFQLREEESLLLQERQCLEQDLAYLRLRVEKERAMNESLKKLKANTTVVEEENGSSTPQRCLPHSLHSGRNSVQISLEKAPLPDLNLPVEE